MSVHCYVVLAAKETRIDSRAFANWETGVRISEEPLFRPRSSLAWLTYSDQWHNKEHTERKREREADVVVANRL